MEEKNVLRMMVEAVLRLELLWGRYRGIRVSDLKDYHKASRVILKWPGDDENQNETKHDLARY